MFIPKPSKFGLKLDFFSTENA